MRYLILVLCLCKLQVEASDWRNRTIRVDLETNRTAFTETIIRQNEFSERSETMDIRNATNGQHPWSIITIAWARSGTGSGTGIPCTSSIISENFALTAFRCTGQHIIPAPATVIEVFLGAARLTLEQLRFMRHFWYIEPSNEDSPNIALLRFHEPLTFNPNIQPIRLPAPGNFSYEGWTSVSTTHLWIPGLRVLQYINFNILSNTACSFLVNFTNHDMCATVDGSLARLFFPGGPWVTFEYDNFGNHATLVGIHRDLLSNETSSIGIGIRVSLFVEWINDTAEIDV